jgi:hypothetical protein
MIPVGDDDGNEPVGEWDGIWVGWEGAWDTDGRMVGDLLEVDGLEVGTGVELMAGSRMQKSVLLSSSSPPSQPGTASLGFLSKQINPSAHSSAITNDVSLRG